MGNHSDAAPPVRRPIDLIGLVLGIALLGVSALFARQRKVDPVERDAFRFINRLPREISGPVQIIMQAGALGATYATAGLALIAGHRRMARDLAASGTLAWLGAKGVKAVVARERPAKLLQDVQVHGAEATGLGFPSGHAAVSAALATAAGPYLPDWARPIAWIVASVVALSRIYVGAHLPVDIVGGAPLGVAAASGVHLLWGVPEDSSPE
jgi:undecaprenyl-diphosphatase